jgi:hypothetical protein
MKKYGLLLVGALFAVGAFAQNQNADIFQYGVHNAAKIDQQGFLQMAKIEQVGFYNGAVLKQEGIFNVGQITQHGFGNFAYLEQEGFFTFGKILQIGGRNLAAVEQESFSYVNVKQFGYGNVLSGVTSHFIPFNSCRRPWITYMHWHFDACDLAIPRGYKPLEVGEGDRLNVIQAGPRNTVLTVGELRGEQWISQRGEHNLIVLGQRNGKSYLKQRGEDNYIYLLMGHHAQKASIEQYGYKNLVGLNLKHGTAKIEQVGSFNQVADFKGDICKHCVNELASFEGDKLMVTQLGIGNKLSLDSESHGSNVTVTQIGYQNWATVKQHAWGHHHP